MALYNFDLAYKYDNSLIIAGIQKYFIKRFFCDWSNQSELNDILKNTVNSEEKVSPWFCLSMEDNAKNHFLRAKNYSKNYYMELPLGINSLKICTKK